MVSIEALNSIAEYIRSLPTWQSFLILVGLSLLAAKLVEFFSVKVVKRVVKNTKSDFDNILFEELKLPIYVTVALAGVFAASDLSFSELENIEFYLRAGTLSVVTVFWSRALIRLGRKLLMEKKGGPVESDLAPIFENLWTFFTLIGTIFLLLTYWEINVTPLLASAGIAGIAIGFAAKDTIANFFGSIALYFDDTYRVGDYVVLDSGEAGTVVDISIRSTNILTRDDVILTVPNSILNSARIINQSAPREKKRIKVEVGVAYGSDIDHVEEVLLEIAEDLDLVAASPEPRARFRSFGGSALKYELLCWVEKPLRDAKATHYLNKEIYQRFNEEGIGIPFPQRDLHIDYTNGSNDGSGVSEERFINEKQKEDTKELNEDEDRSRREEASVDEPESENEK